MFTDVRLLQTNTLDQNKVDSNNFALQPSRSCCRRSPLHGAVRWLGFVIAFLSVIAEPSLGTHPIGIFGFGKLAWGNQDLSSQTQSTPPTSQTNLPTVEEAQQQLTRWTASTEFTPELKTALVESQTRLLESLKKLSEARGRSAKLQEQIDSVPQGIRSVRRDLETPIPPIPEIAASTPIDRVRAIKSQRDAELASAKAVQSELVGKQDNRKIRQTQANELLSALRTQLQQSESEGIPANPEEKIDPLLYSNQKLEYEAKLALLRDRIALQQLDQRAIEAEEELLPLQIQLSSRRVENLEKEVSLLAQAISSRRESQVDESLRKHREMLQQANVDPKESLVIQLGSTWTDIVRKLGETERESSAANASLEKLRKELDDTRSSIDNELSIQGALRSYLGMRLQRLRTRLPDIAELDAQIGNIDVRIDQTGVIQAQIENMLEDLEGKGLRAFRYQGIVNETTLQQETARLLEMNRDIDHYADELLDQKRILDETIRESTEFRVLIDRNVLWIRDLQPYSLSEFPLAWNSFRWCLSPANISALLDSASLQAKKRPDLLLLWVIGVGFLFGMGSRIRRAIAGLGESAGKRNQTSMRATYRVLWMSLVLASPLVLLFGLLGWRLTVGAGDIIYVRAVGTSLVLIAYAIAPIEVLRQIMRRNGLATQHFNIPINQADAIRTTCRLMLDVGTPILFFWGIAHYSGASMISSSLARFLFFLGMLLIAFAHWRILDPNRGIMATVISRRPGRWVDRLRYVWHPTIAALPIVLAILSLAGYSYSAIQLASQLYSTLWLVLGLSLLAGLMRRWGTLSRRRLLLAQLRQRASESEKREAANTDFVIEPSTPDLSEINAQTLRLINALLTVMAVLGFAYMWAPVLPAVRYLDSQVLWYSLDAQQQQTPVTLGNLVSALPIVLLTLVAVRNVPGMLENVLLQKLPLDNAARYAITRLSSYAMLLFGIIYSAQTLGLRWESIQWLVAALGVGLGFGLQEIFANFMSGIILLFEQPIRVGDVVTIEGTTGAVSRIRMRATTIMNWDRQELVIPNKDLITGRLINWTLTDSTNRIVINVGVAYGTDTHKACEILQSICSDHVNIMDDPAPSVAFEGFGDSTLNLVVRCFLRTLDVRIQTIHELHTTINERFSNERIEIAFPQRDIHIRTLPNGLAKLMDRAA